MAGKNDVVIPGGVKVTYIETQFVTSDAAGFKDLVQRLTGRSAPTPPPAPPSHNRPSGGGLTSSAAAAGPPGYYYQAYVEKSGYYQSTPSPAGDVRAAASGAAPPSLLDIYNNDLAQLLHGGVISHGHAAPQGSYCYDTASSASVPPAGGGQGRAAAASSDGHGHVQRYHDVDDMGDLSELFYGGGTDSRRHHGHGCGYSGYFVY